MRSISHGRVALAAAVAHPLQCSGDNLRAKFPSVALTPIFSGEFPMTETSQPVLSCEHRIVAWPVFLFTVALSLCATAFAQTISTVAGNGSTAYSGDGGLATEAGMTAYGVAFGPAGNLFIADLSNHRIRRVDGAGNITTVVGAGASGVLGDGGPAIEAQLKFPNGVFADASGNLFIFELGTHRIRKVDTQGIISTVAGAETAGFSGDGGPATDALLDTPGGLFIDAAGNMFISDADNHRVRKVSAADGTISTIAGTGAAEFGGDGGPAIEASLRIPSGLFVDAAGNLYIADAGNMRVRKVDAAGMISTVAGAGSSGFSGDGGPALEAEFDGPRSVWVDASGNLFVADRGNHRIRKVDTTGHITTVAGFGDTRGRGGGYAGDGGPATEAMLKTPQGLAADGSGNLFIADRSNNRIRKLAAAVMTAVVEVRDGALPESFTLSQNYPNPFNPETTIRFDLPQSGEINLAVYDLAGQKVATLAHGFRDAGAYSLRWDGRDDTGADLASGMYLYRLRGANGAVESRKLLLVR